MVSKVLKSFFHWLIASKKKETVCPRAHFPFLNSFKFWNGMGRPQKTSKQKTSNQPLTSPPPSDVFQKFIKSGTRNRPLRIRVLLPLAGINYVKFWLNHCACHCTNANLQLLDREFGVRVVSRRSIRGQEWPPRSPDLNPCDFCLWGLLK